MPPKKRSEGQRQTLQENNRAKRKARFDAVEQSKPEESRLVERTDLDDVIRRQLSVQNERFYKQAKQWFAEFYEDIIQGTQQDLDGF